MLFLDISDKELVERILILRNKERALTVKFLKYLGELDSRKLYLPAGYSSFFDYCVRKLGYSESGAFRRVECARVLREFPELGDFILQGELNLSVLASAARKLMEGRVKLEQIIGKSCREVEGLIAGLNPLNKPRERIKQISVLVPKEDLPPTLKVGIVDQKFTPGSKVGENNDCLPPTLKVDPSAPNSTHSHSPEHRLETRVEIKFSLSQESFKKLEDVKAALSNKLGSGASVEEIFNELMNRFLKAAQPKSKGPEKCEKSEGVEGKPTNSPAISKKFPIRQKSTNRYIPQGIRRAVIQRDKSACTYVASDGTRCGCKVF